MKKPTIKSLQNKAENLWKEVCLLRDGRECQIKKHYSYVKINHSNIIQVDHCFERSNKYLFLEPANGTPLCSVCNMLKSYKKRGVDRLVDLIVRKREGDEKYKKMLEIAISGGSNLDWDNRGWLEKRIEELLGVRTKLEMKK